MIRKSSISAALLLLSAMAAHAEDLDMTKIKCKDFISAPKDHISIILAWLEGFYTKESDPPIIFSDKMAKDAKNLNTYCNDHGDDNIVHAADMVMPVK
ncbi:MAG TPA: HdeA/HdeB family chaperone [Stellaceae bacterium]|nr:HdeA/HdeB family chaperone [Stellaceae bacterium]